MEIERKFLLQSVPQAHRGVILREGVSIEQGYFVTQEGELRLRHKGSRFFLTIKSEGGLVREEWEQEIPQWAFEMLWPNTEGRRIQKNRYTVPYGAYNLEIDEFSGVLQGLVILECEFPRELLAASLNLPVWVQGAVEVTGNPVYSNRNLALQGLPSYGDMLLEMKES